MEGFLGFLFIIVFIVILVQRSKKVAKLEQKIETAEAEISILTRRVSAIEQHTGTHPSPVSETAETRADEARDKTDEPRHPSESIERPETTAAEAEIRTAKPSSPQTSPAHMRVAEQTAQAQTLNIPQPPAKWQKFEKQIAENWTGIVGTIVLVLGIGFLGVYTALRMNEFFRFLMIIGCAALLAGAFFLLRKKEKWIKLALWMRSASGAVFLFACLGAGGIPGLHWIHDPLWALLVLMAGIALNLYLAVIDGRQVIASLHVVLSLAALTVAPQNETTLAIASIVAIFGISLTFREKWDYHLLLSLSSFFLYHIYWYIQMGGKAAMNSSLNFLGIVIVSVVCITGACVHYRKLYGSKDFEKTPFLVHMINWVYFGLGILMHVSGQKWKTVPLFIGAAAAFALAHHAKKLNIRWLHCMDTLVAQIVAIIGMFSLAGWGVDYDIVFTIVFLETLVFIRIILIVKEEILYRAGIAVSQAAGTAVLIAFLLTGSLLNNSLCIRQCALAGVCAGAVFALHWYLARLKNARLFTFDSVISLFPSTPEVSITGVMTGLFLLAGGVMANDIFWLRAAVIATVVILIALRPRVNTNGLTLGTALAVLLMHALTWYALYADGPLTTGDSLARGLPLFLLSFAFIRWSSIASMNQQIKWFGIYLSVIHFTIMAHAVLNPISPLIPGVCWLIGSLVVLEIASVISARYKDDTTSVGEPDRYLLHCGYLLLSLFFVRHILVHIQSEEYIWIIKIRFAIEALAIATLLYWAFARRGTKPHRLKSWNVLHPLFVEFIIIFAVLTISVEVSKQWHPLVWIASAFLSLLIGTKVRPLSRLKAYSVLFYWVSILQVTFLLGTYARLGTKWYEQDWLLGTLAIMFQFGFLTLFHKMSPLSHVSFPPALRRFDSSVVTLHKRQNSVLFYPLLICVALFFYWTFSKSLLTLLWVLECFTVFVISIVLKEKHFRYAALTGIVLCIVRLVFFDLARSTTLVKALVFLGVGIVMIVMHSLYTKFKDRVFEEKPHENS